METTPATNHIDSPAPESKLITNLDDALDLSIAKRNLDQRVKAVATVTYCHPQWRMLFVQSGELGTFLSIPTDTPPLKPGDVVEIDGTTTMAHGYPEIQLNSLKPTGQWQTLVTRNWALDDILNGRASGQWLQIEGKVLAAYQLDGRMFIETAVGATNITSYLLNWPADEASQLLDARVRITGVLRSV